MKNVLFGRLSKDVRLKEPKDFKTVVSKPTDEELLAVFPWLDTVTKRVDNNCLKLFEAKKDTDNTTMCIYKVIYKDYPVNDFDVKEAEKLKKLLGDEVIGGMSTYKVDCMLDKKEIMGSAHFRFIIKKAYNEAFKAIAEQLLKDAGRL